MVENIENVSMAHIHLAPAGVDGPVVAWLYPEVPPAVLIPGRFDGLLAEGNITSINLSGPLAGQPLNALLEAMIKGNTYVNVHTNQYPEWRDPGTDYSIRSSSRIEINNNFTVNCHDECWK